MPVAASGYGPGMTTPHGPDMTTPHGEERPTDLEGVPEEEHVSKADAVERVGEEPEEQVSLPEQHDGPVNQGEWGRRRDE